jgi:thermostable 8-oxoguanine DNA glycosylase
MNYLIDPSNITKFDCNDYELQLMLLFWICAAGKKASTAAANLNRLMLRGKGKFVADEPFEIIRMFGADLSEELRVHGIGCYNNKGKSMMDLAQKGLDLKTCSVYDLESVRGIGPKTARCFLLHSRRGARFAGLDVHLLKFMRMIGYDAPKTTPGKKSYLFLEGEFLGLVDRSGMSVAKVDLLIWNYYSSRDESSEKDMRVFLQLIGLEHCLLSGAA